MNKKAIPLLTVISCIPSTILCNDIVCDFDGMLWYLFAMLWDIQIKGLNDMERYGMLWDLIKNASIYKSVPNFSKDNISLTLICNVIINSLK